LTTIHVNWGASRVNLTWRYAKQLPARNLITSVHGLCFKGDRLLLVNLNYRGWDFPGGHLEPEETPLECFKREVMEEGYVSGECKHLGHIVVDHCNTPKWNDYSLYPKVGYQVFYRMEIENLYVFRGEYESVERMFVDPSEVHHYYYDWNEICQEILDYASYIKN